MKALLHTHSQYSWDSQLQSNRAAGYARDLGYEAYALTDHATVAGLVEHEKACKKAEIKPLLGCEIYFQPEFETSKQRTHLTLIARDNQGLANIYEMLSEAAKKNFYYVPVVTADILSRHATGVIILSGCLSSLSSRLILAGQNVEFGRLIEFFISIADKDSFFLELQPFPVLDANGNDMQRDVNNALLLQSAKRGLPIVLTGDSHFVSPNEYEAYKQALAIARDKADVMADYSMRFLQSPDIFWDAYKTQMILSYADVGASAKKGSPSFNDMMDAVAKIADSCEATTFRKPQLPVMGFTNSRKELTNRVVAGLKARNVWLDPYKLRARYELERIFAKNFCDYILMVDEEFQWYASINMPATIRGSAAGSLVCYALGLTKVDPLKYIDAQGETYGFDRFLGEDREDLPDIDIDVPDRDMAVAHFQQTYQGKTALVTAHGRWQAKNLVNKLETALPMDKADASVLKRILLNSNIDASGLIGLDLLPDSPEFAELEKKYAGLLKLLKLMHNSINYTGTHASAIVVTREPIETQLALVSVSKAGSLHRTLQACYGKDDLESVGGVKVDILGNDGLRAIQIAEENAGVSFEEAWLEDAETLKNFYTDNGTVGINQFEKSDASKMIKQVAKALGEFTFADLIAINAINRPGAASVSDYIKGGNDAIVAPFCQDSRGAMIYQEQAMRLLRYAGLSWSEVGKFLKSNKRKEKNPALRASFIAGMTRYGHSLRELEKVYDRLEGRYLFNKAHATSYALMAMEEMYLKVHHPYSWYLGLLSSEGNLDKRRIYTSDATQHKIIIVPPHINGGVSYRGITLVLHGKTYKAIQEGLTHLEGIGEATAKLIEDELLLHGDYLSEDDFLARFDALKKVAKTNGERFKSPTTPATLETLRKFGCVEFDPQTKLNQILDYNRSKVRQVVYIP